MKNTRENPYLPKDWHPPVSKPSGRERRKLIWLLLIALAVFLLICLAPLMLHAECGTERWLTKTLKDPGAQQIDFSQKAAVLHDLIEVKPPANLRTVGEAVRFPEERQTYTVSAVLLGFKREADGDYHLVLADPVDRRKTMIAEIPSTACAPKQYAQQFTAAGRFVDGISKAVPKFKRLAKPVPVSVTGVFFFDFIHGQTGVAPNGAELHPVLKIEAAK